MMKLVVHQEWKSHCGVFLVFFIFTSLIDQGLCTAGLYSPDIYGAQVYSSSVAPGSRPEYAVDADFYAPAPTCFSTNYMQPDTKGLNWIVLDFGKTIRKLKEVRLVTESNTENQGDEPSEMDIFLSTNLDTSNKELSKSDPHNMKHSLNWDSNYFEYCSSTNWKEARGKTVTVQCEHPLNGRWLAIRRKQALHICLVSIYVEKAFDECFRPLPNPSDTQFRGSVFRYIRHVSLHECQAACTKTSNCDAILFEKRRFSGNCQLVQSFTEGNSDQDVEENEDLACSSNDCVILKNDCHEGILRKLEIAKTASDTVETFQEKINNGMILQDWSVVNEKYHHPSGKEKPSQTSYLLAVYFDGRLDCSDWDCGVIYVYSVDKEGKEALCTFIRTEEAEFLENTRYRCDYSSELPVNTMTIRLKWKPRENDDDRKTLKISLSQGHVRISFTKPLVDVRKPETVEEIDEKKINVNDSTKNVLDDGLGGQTSTTPLPPITSVKVSISDVPNLNANVSFEQGIQSIHDLLRKPVVPELPDGVDEPPILFQVKEQTYEQTSEIQEYSQLIRSSIVDNETQFDQPQNEEQLFSKDDSEMSQKTKVLHHRGAVISFNQQALQNSRSDSNSVAIECLHISFISIPLIIQAIAFGL